MKILIKNLIFAKKKKCQKIIKQNNNNKFLKQKVK